MTLLETLNYFIGRQEGELEGLSWDILEETNFEDNQVDRLSEFWDYEKEHLENLKTIKNLIMETESRG
jgi:hypothetical protein